MKITSLTSLAAACAALLSLSACTTSEGRYVALPIHTSGSVASVRTLAHGDTLYVTGTVKPTQGISIPHSTHVDIQLIDAKGHVIAQAQQAIKPPYAQSARSSTGRIPYTLSFPAKTAAQARSILVSYHPESHQR